MDNESGIDVASILCKRLSSTRLAVTGQEIVNSSLVQEKKLSCEREGIEAGRSFPDIYFRQKSAENISPIMIPRTENMSQSDVDGLYDVYWENGERLNAESATLTGTLKALFEVRDGNN